MVLGWGSRKKPLCIFLDYLERKKSQGIENEELRAQFFEEFLS